MMSFPSHQDEPRSSRRGRRTQRRGSSASSGQRETSASDDNRGPSRVNYMEVRVESWREWYTSYYPRVLRVASLPPDPQRSRALPEFQYYPLEEGTIRVLRLLAGNKRDRVRCELDHMLLANPLPYTALSYAWGDTYHKVDIELNRGFFKVTKSLYDALKAVREPDHNILVWADAVCINQDDNEERSKQVQEMYRIYQQARLVGVWLGPEADDSDLAISLIYKLTEQGLSRKEIRQIIYSRSWELHFHALADLFERDYWNRLWVVQEVNNSKKPMVYCGDNRTDLDRYIRVSYILRPFKDDLELRFVNCGTRVQRRGYWIHLLEHGPARLVFLSNSSLDWYLSYFRTSLTSDPRDKLYGLLGILPSNIRKSFPPDYKSSPEKLYIDIVDYSLRTSGSLNIICQAHSLAEGLKLPRLPSWVPDWSQTGLFLSLGARCGSWDGLQFRASGSFQREAQLLGDTRSKLKMKAIHIGSVKILGAPLPNMLNQHTTILALIDWWHIFKESSSKDNESFCRTITLGQINDELWTSVCCHIIGMIARHELPGYASHPDLQANPSKRIDRQRATAILDKEILDRLSDQTFFVTQNNDLGLARGFLDPDDVVCIPLGCKTPVILRRDGRDGEYIFHGDAYVDGFMYGEAIELWKRGQMELRTYILH